MAKMFETKNWKSQSQKKAEKNHLQIKVKQHGVSCETMQYAKSIAGVHGGTKRQHNKRERRKNKVDLRDIS